MCIPSRKRNNMKEKNYLKNNIQLYHNRKSAWLFVFKHHQEACPHGQHIQSPAREDATKNPLWILVHNKMKHRVILIQPILLCIPAVTKYDSIFLWWKFRHKLMYHRCSKLKIVFFFYHIRYPNCITRYDINLPLSCH